MKLIRPALAFLLLACAAAGAAAADRIVLEKPLLDPQTRETTAWFDGVIQRIVAAANRLHGSDIEVAETLTGRTDYRLRVTASRKPGATSIVFVLEKASNPSANVTYPFIGDPPPEYSTLLAHAVHLLWSSLSGRLSRQPGPAPVFVDELPAEAFGNMLVPMSLATMPDGSLAVGLSTTCAVLDPTFRLIATPGKSLYDKGLYVYASGVSVTPSGTLILKPGSGKNLYRLPPGVAEPIPMPAGVELTMISASGLDDGSVLLVDMANRKATRLVDKKRRELALFPDQNSYTSVVATSPDGLIWIWDILQKAFRVHTADGVLVGHALPLVDPSEAFTPTAVSIGTDGGYIACSSGKIWRFAADGHLVWRVDTAVGASPEDIPQWAPLAVDWKRGLVYVADTANRRVLKFLDRTMGRGAEGGFDEKIVEIRSRAATDVSRALVDRARLYEAAESTLMAKVAWQAVLDDDSGNAEAEKRLAEIELDELRRSADELAAKARSVLQSIGVETARQYYSQAAQRYEQLLARNPSDTAAAASFRDLKKLFSEGGTGQGTTPQALTIERAAVEPVFPSLIKRYLETPIGSVTVKNVSSRPVENVKVSAFINAYMDFPAEMPGVARIAAGATATVPLLLTFAPGLTEVQEDLPVQVLIEVSGTVSGAVQMISKTVTTTVLRRTALVWDDTRKIAAFITPNDDTVSGFALRTASAAEAGARQRLSARLLRAMRIIDALGVYGITYVEDPDAPITKVLGSSTAVDTVRFPRTTLANRTGDCDDTTVLLASLLEAAGIRTMVLTTPGHIFLAFDSDGDAENAALLATRDLEIVSAGGTAWIPIETTVLKDGFMAAWKAASSLVRKHRPTGGLGTYAFRDIGSAFPSMPLKPSSITVAEPAPAAVSERFDASVARLDTEVYLARLAELESQAKGLTGRQQLRVRMLQGILHALFGRNAEAEKAFRAAKAMDPAMISPYVNIANLRLLDGDLDGAIAELRSGLAKAPDSPVLNLALARCYADKGDAKNAATHLAVVKKVSPDLAARFPELVAQPQESSGRGSFSGGFEPSLWSSED
jgi:tetratricopeptide (TPR) repeat protein